MTRPRPRRRYRRIARDAEDLPAAEQQESAGASKFRAPQVVHEGTAIIGVAGGSLTIAGSLLPWATAGTLAIPGTSGDGGITVLLGGVTIVLFALWWSSGAKGNLLTALALLAAVASLAIIGDVYLNVESLSPDGLVVEPGPGLVVGGLGAGASAFAAVRALFYSGPDLEPELRDVPEMSDDERLQALPDIRERGKDSGR